MVLKIIALAFLLITNESFGQQPSVEEQAIKETVWNYVNGRNTGDSVQLKKAFHSQATLKFIDNNGDLMKWNAADYIKRMSTGKKQDCTGEILEVKSFSDAAQATVVLKYSNVIYYDYLNLLKVRGTWLITDKIFSKKSL